MPRRPATSHKGRFGHVLIIGGNLGMAGAARLAGEAALRSGAGPREHCQPAGDGQRYNCRPSGAHVSCDSRASMILNP